mgnify:CR=1 FL=1
MEAAAEGSALVIDDATFTYAGLYVLDYRDDPERFAQAVQACRQATQSLVGMARWANAYPHALPERVMGGMERGLGGSAGAGTV